MGNKKVVKDLEREDTRLNGIVIQEQAEIKTCLNLQWDELLHALGGVSPDLVQWYKDKGREELENLLEKSLKALGFSDHLVAQAQARRC